MCRSRPTRAVDRAEAEADESAASAEDVRTMADDATADEEATADDEATADLEAATEGLEETATEPASMTKSEISY